MKGARMPVLPWGNRSCPFLLACWIVGSIAFTHGASRNKDLRIDALVEDLFNKSSKLVNQQDPATHRGPHLPRPLPTSEVEPSTETPDISPPLKSTDGPDITASPVDTPDDLTQTIEPDTYTTTPSKPNDNPDVAASPVDTPDDLTPQETPKTYTTAPYKTPDDPTYTSRKPSSPPLKSTDGPNVPGGPDSASEMSPLPQTSSNSPHISIGPTETNGSLTDASITTNQSSPTSSDTFPVPTSTDIPGSPGGPDTASETPSILTESASTPDILNGPTEASDASTTTNETLPGDNVILPPTKLTNSPDSSADTDSKSDNLSSSTEPSPDVPADPSSTSDTPSPPPELSSTPDVPASPSTTFDTVSLPPEPSSTPDVPAGPSSTSDTSSPHPELSTTSDVSAGPSSTPDTPSPPPESSSTSDVPAGPSSTPDTTSPPPESSSTPDVPAGPSSTADTPSPPPELSSTPDVPVGPSSTPDTPSPPPELSSSPDVPVGPSSTADTPSPPPELSSTPDVPVGPSSTADTPSPPPELSSTPDVRAGPSSTGDTPSPPLESSSTSDTPTGTNRTTDSSSPRPESPDSPDLPTAIIDTPDKQPSSKLVDLPFVQTGPANTSDVSTQTGPTDPSYTPYTTGTTNTTELPPSPTSTDSPETPADVPPSLESTDSPDIQTGASPISDSSVSTPTASIDPQSSASTSGQATNLTPAATGEISGSRPTLSSFTSPSAAMDSDNTEVKSSDESKAKPTASAFSVAAVTPEDNSMTHAETHHAMPTVSVRESDASQTQTSDMSYRPTTSSMGSSAPSSSMVADAPTVSMVMHEDSTSEGMDTTHSDSDVMARSEDSRHSSVHAWFKSHKKNTASKDTIIDRKVGSFSRGRCCQINGGDQNLDPTSKTRSKYVNKVNGAEQIYTTIGSQNGPIPMDNVAPSLIRLNNPGGKGRCMTPMDVAFLIQGSGTMGFLKWYKTRMFFQHVIDGLHVSKAGSNVGLVELSGPYKPMFQFSYYKIHKLVRAIFGILPYPRGDRNLGKGMKTVKKLLFDARSPSRKNVKKVLIVFADSKSTDDISAPAKALKESGVEVFAIGYEKAAKCSKRELAKIVSKPRDDHMIFTSLFVLNLRKVAKRITNTMCKSRDPAPKKTPKKGENKKVLKKLQEKEKKGKKGEQKKEKIKSTKEMKVKSDKKVATKKGNGKTPNIKPKSKAVKTNKISKVKAVKEAKGKTKFTKKLKVKTVKKVKKKNGNKKILKAVAKSIKKIVKKGGNKKITKAVVKVKKIIKGKTKLKKSGARKINKNSCFKNTKVCDAIVDLAFLIDGSTAVGMKNFKKSIAFALRVIKNFAVSKLGTHVSVVVFSNQPHVIFDLQAYYNHASLEKAMQNIAYPKIKNPKITYTKLGSGLRVVKTSVFKDSGRLNIPKMLFVMSSSTSADNVKIPALSLRSTGVVIYALGMGSAFSPTQLKTIATYSPIEHVVATRFAYLDCLEPWLARHLCSAAGGRLRKLTVSGKARSLIEAGNALKPKAVSKQMLAQRKKMLIEKKKKLAEKKEKIKKHLRMRLHQLLSRLGSGKRKDEELVYRSLIYNINGHRGKGDCKDTHVVCSKWRSEGLCERSTDGFDVQSVQKVCPKSCGICLP